MPQLTILLDLGGVITDKRRRAAQWPRLIGEHFAPLLGKTPQEWTSAHQFVTDHLSHQDAILQQSTPDFVTFHRTYHYYWLRDMCKLLDLPIPSEEVCITLAYQALASISSHIQAALPGAVEAIQTLHTQGYALHTASGIASFEIAGYLEAIGVRSCFGRCYGSDLLNTFKQGPEYFARLYADLDLKPAETLVVDDETTTLAWASQLGARTVLIKPSHVENETIACIKSLAALPAWPGLWNAG